MTAPCTCCAKHRRRALRERRDLTADRDAAIAWARATGWKLAAIAACMLVVMAALLVRLMMESP